MIDFDARQTLTVPLHVRLAFLVVEACKQEERCYRLLTTGSGKRSNGILFPCSSRIVFSAI